MLKRLLPLVLFLAFLGGCATVHESFQYSDSNTNFNNGMTIYYQIEMSYIDTVKDKEVMQVVQVPINKEFKVHEKANGLAMGIYIKNTKDLKYFLLEEFSVLHNGEDEPYEIKHKMKTSSLPEKVYSIKLPISDGEKVRYAVKVMSEGGAELFRIGDVIYTKGS